ncbi:hypothetical protein LXL04_035965 [Taraxacum kok-saghyz]
MGSRVCMNDLCGASLAAAGDYKKGWALRSGDFASLCDKCGTAYEQLAFCELFHLADTGWRECTSCGKRLHCGCIASSSFIELLESGGVSCTICSNSLPENSIEEIRSSSNKMLKQSSDDGNGQKYPLPSENDDASTSQMKLEETLPLPLHPKETQTQTTSTAFKGTKAVEYRENTGGKSVIGSLMGTDLTIGLASSSSSSQKPVFLPVNGRGELGPWSHSHSQSRHILPKVPKSVFSHGFDANVGMNLNSQIRIARPPVEGRIKNQLLPRYWPRITEQELQQISGDSNATVVPLFEKVLSASDAGRIGRLVLPKACAEAYFPPISQPEGLPIRIQDVKGKEWLFQFRFWPNNNSRMYVLEGVTPCIQSMQLKAGDTVTFSRMEPEGKLLMGFRKASLGASVQDSRIAAMHNGVFPSGPSTSGVNNNNNNSTIENLSNISDYSGLLQSLKRNTDSQLNSMSRNMNLTTGDASWHGSKSRADSFQPDKKRSRNISSKSKRLVIESQEALELKYTWEELQDLLTPPTTLNPSTVTIEDHEFEEYEEPPVFGKGSIFTVRSSGEQEQWAQCDNCSKWRRLPVDFLLPAKWTCQENVWDHARSTCHAPDELGPRELEHLLKLAKVKKADISSWLEFQKWKNSTNQKPDQDQGGPSTDNNIQTEPPDPTVATTTKHPRHRPGCSCIVCSQPPSGKGKHKPNCTCNVCMTVKRRFKTLMLRKQQRQSEREAEITEKYHLKLGPGPTPKQESDPTTITAKSQSSQLDLNIRPHGTTMMSLLQAANQPLETYMKQNGLTTLIPDPQPQPQASSGSQPLPQPQTQASSSGQDEVEPRGPHNNQNSS